MVRKSSPGLRLLLLFFLAAALLSAGAAAFALSGLRRNLLRDIEQSMSLKAARGVAVLTARFGALDGQAEAFAGRDLLALFALEAEESGLTTGPPEKGGAEGAENSATPAEDAGYPEESVPGLRLPLLRGELREFTQKSGFAGAAILGRNLSPYLSFAPSPELLPEFSADEAPALAAVFSTGLPLHSPARLSQGTLFMDMAFPIFADVFSASPGEQERRVAAILALRRDVSEDLRALGDAGDGLYSRGVIQENQGLLQLLEPGAGQSLPELSGWRLEQGSLPPAARPWPRSGDRAHVLALPVPGLPWLVYEAAEAAPLEARAAELVRVAWVAAGLCTLLLTLLPWALLQRRAVKLERAAADELRRLYQLADQQRQILDGVNSALSAGIALNDLDGTIYYANAAFTRMAGLEAGKPAGFSYRELTPPLARSLALLTRAACSAKYRAQSESTLPEITLSMDGLKRRFLASCSPFLDQDGEMIGAVSIYNDVTELHAAHEHARQLAWKIVDVFVRAMEAVDPYLSGRCALLAVLAPPLAAALDEKSESRAATLRAAALLSRVGMLRLFSSSPRGELLDETGRKELRRHVDYAREALLGIDFGLPVLEAVTGMYERLDGSGYPAGLKGDEVDLNARILGAVDSFCAMIRPRSYRKAYSPENALELLASSPSYDPAVIAALRDFLRSKPGLEILAATGR
jgi:PAS domain S-box-containing protein